MKSNKDLKYVLHTASPFHFNVQDPVKDFLEPAVQGSTGVLKAVHSFAPNVSRIVLTSSIAAMRNDDEVAPHYTESSWSTVTWDEAASNTRKTYQGSKVCVVFCFLQLTSQLTNFAYRHSLKKRLGSL